MPADLSRLRETWDDIKYELPYGPGLWKALREWPDEWSASLNTIVRFISFDCNGTWTVLVDTLLPALGEMVIVLLDFGWDDVARGFFRPSGIRSRHRMRRGKKHGHGRGRRRRGIWDWIPEIGEEIGAHLPGARIVKGRKVGALSRWLWQIDGVLQRGLFYWMMADVITDFGYGWLIGILRHEACWYSGEGWATGGPGMIAWSAGVGPIMIGHRAPVKFGGDDPPISMPFTVVEGRRYYALCDLGEAIEIAGEVEAVQVRLEDVDTGNVIDASPWLKPGTVADVAPVTVDALDKPGRYAFVAEARTPSWGVVAFPQARTAIKWITWPPKIKSEENDEQ